MNKNKMWIVLIFGIIWVIMSTNNKILIEGYENNLVDVDLSPTTSFCQLTNSGKNMEESCNSLTYDNCNQVSCCGWLKSASKTKCVYGNKSGPVFKTFDGIPIEIDEYRHNNICYGSHCKKNEL
jgi:hypothetical protein